MAEPSGTVGLTTVDVGDVLDEAILRCGAQPAQMTPEIVATLTRNLYLILSRLTNRGVALWGVEKSLLALRTDRVSYPLLPGTVSILEANYRKPTRLTYTGSPTATFGAATAVPMVGLLPAATGTVTLVFETSNDGLAWTQVAALGTVTVTAGVWAWYDVDPAPESLYWRVRATTGVLSLTDLFLANEASEISITPMTREDYAALPDKRVSGQVLQYWFDRQIPPVMHVWRKPETNESCVVYWRQRQPQDVGDLAGRLDLPAQWLDAVIYKLASQAIMVIPGADLGRQTALLELAERFEREASDDETDHAPRRYYPDISGYTR